MEKIKVGIAYSGSQYDNYNAYYIEQCNKNA